jgi:hypothetical protein
MEMHLMFVLRLLWDFTIFMQTTLEGSDRRNGRLWHLSERKNMKQSKMKRCGLQEENG